MAIDSIQILKHLVEKGTISPSAVRNASTHLRQSFGSLAVVSAHQGV